MVHATEFRAAQLIRGSLQRTFMSHLVFVETSGSGTHAIEYAKAAGHTVTLLYSPRYDFTASREQRLLARKLADRTAELGEGDSPADLIAALRAAGTDPGEVDAVLSTLAFGIPPAAALAAALGVAGTSAEAVAIARDKGRCREALRAAGAPSLEFAVVTTVDEALAAAEAIGYPVIVKPVLGVGKAATTITRSPQDVRTHFAEAAEAFAGLATGMSAHFDDRFIVEELAVGDLYSVEVAADGTDVVALASTLQKTASHDPVLELGCTVPTGLTPAEEDEMRSYAVQVCRVLGLDLGVFHVEMMRTARGFRLTEANPRIAGGALPETINAAADQNMFEVLVNLFTGQPVPAPLRFTGAASHSVLGAATPGTVRADLPADWFAEVHDKIHSGWVRAEPGTRLDVMRGNFDRFGMIRVVAPDADEAKSRCLEVKRTVERKLGIPLIREAGAEEGSAAP